MTAFARIDNVFDERYHNPTGFFRPGMSDDGLKIAIDPLGAFRTQR